jgi:hypothetical protein
VPYQLDHYTFHNATPGNLVSFDYLAGAGPYVIGWRLTDPSGEVIFDGGIGDHLITLLKTGNYVMTAYAFGANVGPYSFSTTSVGKDSFGIEFGDIIESGLVNSLPQAGAGNIELPGGQDIYTIPNDALNKTIWFNYQAGPGYYGQGWRLVDPNGEVIFDGGVSNQLVILTEVGDYKLTVYGAGLTTGAYKFQTFVIGKQSFNIGFGDIVEGGLVNGLPLTGVGNLELPGTQDIYTIFNDAIGKTVWFNYQAGPGYYAQGWRLVDPNGEVIFDGGVSNQLVILTKVGNYKLTAYGAGQSTGAYKFQTFVIGKQSFNIGFGDVIAQDLINGLPEFGAGNLELPGTQDVYTFTVTDSRQTLFDYISGPGYYAQGWRLVDPVGKVIFDAGVSDQNVKLTKPGIYTLVIYGSGQSTGGYSFQLQ